MNSFSNIKELIFALYKEHKLLTEMFKKRKTLTYKNDIALELVDFDQNRIQYLLERSVIRQNGDFLEIEEEFLQFFEKVLEVNEEINISYINENIKSIKENVGYYFKENNEHRKYNYLRSIKNTIRKVGLITLRNVIDLKRNIETTYKNEPNYKIKIVKLENLDSKRKDIGRLIEQTEYIILEDEQTFFKTALDEELNRIITEVRLQLGKSTHNLIEIEKQIINYLNQIKYHSSIVEKLRQIKYLKDQYTLQSDTNFDKILLINHSVIFESKPTYPIKLSIEYLQSNEEAFKVIEKVAKKLKSGNKLKQAVADKISDEYLETQIEEEEQVNLEELKNSFIATNNGLFDFIMNYKLPKDKGFEERVTIYCQIVSHYENELRITNDFEEKKGVEYTMVYPK